MLKTLKQRSGNLKGRERRAEDKRLSLQGRNRHRIGKRLTGKFGRCTRRPAIWATVALESAYPDEEQDVFSSDSIDDYNESDVETKVLFLCDSESYDNLEEEPDLDPANLICGGNSGRLNDMCAKQVK